MFFFAARHVKGFWRGVLEAESVGSSGWLRFDGQRVTAQELAPHVQLFRTQSRVKGTHRNCVSPFPLTTYTAIPFPSQPLATSAWPTSVYVPFDLAS